MQYLLKRLGLLLMLFITSYSIYTVYLCRQEKSRENGQHLPFLLDCTDDISSQESSTWIQDSSTREKKKYMQAMKCVGALNWPKTLEWDPLPEPVVPGWVTSTYTSKVDSGLSLQNKRTEVTGDHCPICTEESRDEIEFWNRMQFYWMKKTQPHC